MAIDTRSSTAIKDNPDSSFQPAALLDALNCAVLLVYEDGTIAYRNRTATEWFASAPTIEDLFCTSADHNERRSWRGILAQAISERTSVITQRVFRPAGATDPVIATIHVLPYRATTSTPAKLAVVQIDGLHAERESDEDARSLEVSRRLTSLGKLATRVAHELNNPLDGILRYINLALRLVPDAPESKLHNYLAESRTGLMRMVQIISDLLEFSRTSDGQFDDATVNEIVEQAIKSQQELAKSSNTVIASDFQTLDVPAAHGNRLYQVCTNLIKNAIEAVPDGGRVTITTGVVGRDIVIQVADTGPGLPHPVEKVFEAFFTTKAAGEGTGIGLAICRDFVSDMNGTITASNHDDGGAVFTIRVPLTEPSTSRESGTAPLLDKEGLGEVLLRSDNPPQSPLGKGGGITGSLSGNDAGSEHNAPTRPE